MYICACFCRVDSSIAGVVLAIYGVFGCLFVYPMQNTRVMCIIGVWGVEGLTIYGGFDERKRQFTRGVCVP